ncbi:MAG: MFS transporter [Ardenticatenales bacterium]
MDGVSASIAYEAASGPLSDPRVQVAVLVVIGAVLASMARRAGAASPAAGAADDVAIDDAPPSGRGALRALRALRNRRFALLWTGQTLSRIGDYVYEIVLAWWVLEVTGSAAVMGAVLIVTFLPTAVFTIIGGAVVDRVPRLAVMLASDVLRAVAVLGVAAWAYAGHLTLWPIYALGLLFGIADAFFNPAYFALVPELVDEADLPSANALTSMSFQLGRVVGPVIGGLIVAAGGVKLGLTINGISFVLAAALLVPLLRRAARRDAGDEAAPSPDANAAPPRGMLADVRDGFAAVAGSPIIRTGILVNALAAACLVGPFLVAMPFLVADRFDKDPRVLGFLLAFFPIGFVLGSLWGGRHDRLPHRGRVMYGGLAVAALMLTLYGLPVPLPVLAAAALVNGFALELTGLAWTGLLQDLIPADKLGRAASLDQLAGFIAIPIAFAAAGWSTEHVGAAQTFLVGGAMAAVLAGVALAIPAVWKAA